MIAKIIEYSLQLRWFMLLLTIGIMALGLYAYIETPRDAFPDISPVMVPIFAEAPGLAAEEVEMMIAQPIESYMNGLPNVTLVKSTSSFGLGVIYVYFEDNVDIYFARQIVAERLQSAQSLLPSGIEQPELGPISTGLGQIFIYYLEADPNIVDTEGKDVLTYLRELNDFVVKRQLQTVRGVTSILSMGGYVLQYQIRVNPESMRRYNISFQDIVEAVQVNNRNVGGQYVEIGSEEFLVRGIGMLKTLNDIGNITLRETNGIPLHIHDVAEVTYGSDIRRGVVTRNGEREVVAGIVLKLYGENTSKVIAALHKKLPDVQRSLPKGVTIVANYDQADLVNNASYTVESALYQGIFFVIIILALFLLNIRAAIIVALAMPYCGALSMIALKFFGYSANLMSLGGIAIALGMLVDGSIVVVENVIRHYRMPENQNKSKIELVRDAAKEVAKPISAALLIIIAVFIPIFLFEEVEGKMFKPLAFTIVIALAGSILATVINAPVLSYLLIKAPKKIKELVHKYSFTVRNIYLPILKLVLKVRYLLFIGVAVLLFYSLSVLITIGREFIPTLEEGTLLITVNMAPSIGLSESEHTIRNLERIILTVPEIDSTVSRIGRPEAGSHPHPVNFAEIQAALKHTPGKSIGAEDRKRIVNKLRAVLKDYPGVNINYSQPIQNAFDELLSGTRAYFALKVYGENIDILRAKAEEVKKAISHIPGVVDLSTEQSYGQPQLKIDLKHDEMSRLGITSDQVLRLIENGIGGQSIGTIYKNTRHYDINIRIAEDYRLTPEQLGRLKIRTGSNRYIDLNQVANISILEGPVQIQRENNQRRWTIQGNISGRAPSDIIHDMREVIASKINLPTGYYVEFGGQFESQERAMQKLMIVVPIVIGLIFLLLCMTFHSLRSSLIVMINVPLSLIGGVLGLVVTHQLLSVPAMVGFIALFGIAMQDAVVMICDFRDLRASGVALYDAIIQGSAVRFRAVILTTLTTLLGLLPLLLSNGIGAEVQKPLAAIVVFGLSSSTLLTLFFLPTLYYEIEKHY